MTADDIKKSLTPAAKKPSIIPAKDLLSSGSTLLNLACSGRTVGAFAKGHYYLIVGDSSSGKTVLVMTTLAEAAISTNFKKYRFIFDNAENGMLMDVARFFGPRVAERLEPPKVDKKGLAINSGNQEEFYYNLDAATSKGPCIYILDSMDALAPKVDIDRFKKGRERAEKGEDEEAPVTSEENKKKEKGSYGTDKAKQNSSMLRLARNGLEKHGSILIVLGQTRQNIGFDAMFNPKTRGGGLAMTFYATLELWTSIRQHIKTKHKGKDVEQGIVSRIRVKKNRISGRDRSVDVPIFHSTGVDDLGSCVDYLVEWKHWPKLKGSVTAKEWAVSCDRESLVAYIEEKELEDELKIITAEVWNSIEEAVAITRKPRYT
jgi:RecA/RadA recombinase